MVNILQVDNVARGQPIISYLQPLSNYLLLTATSDVASENSCLEPPPRILTDHQLPPTQRQCHQRATQICGRDFLTLLWIHLLDVSTDEFPKFLDLRFYFLLWLQKPQGPIPVLEYGICGPLSPFDPAMVIHTWLQNKLSPSLMVERAESLH